MGYQYSTRTLGPVHPVTNAARYYIHSICADLKASALEMQDAFRITDWDDLGVHVAYGNEDAGFSSYLALGMAYLSIQYIHVTPTFSTVHGIINVNGCTENCVSLRLDEKIGAYTCNIRMNNGQVWKLYAFASSSFSKYLKIRIGTNEIAFDEKFTGTIQCCIVEDPTLCKNVECYFDDSAGAVLQGATWSMVDAQQYQYAFTISRLRNTTFLHFAMPHHASTLRNAQKLSLELHATTHGLLSGYKCDDSIWCFQLPDTSMFDDLGFLPKPAPSMDLLHEYEFETLLGKDIFESWALPVNGSYYFNGKALQKYATLCLLCKSTNSNHYEEGITKLKTMVLQVAENKVHHHPLVYDTLCGGIISSEGLDKNDALVDFGNTVYNDHHFHYGYYITAMSIFMHLEPTFVDDHPCIVTFTTTLLDDVINAESSCLFPRFRHFEWFHGHSYAHGLTSVMDGKDQESVSEEVNLHYGMYLWSMVTKNESLKTLAKLMLQVNLSSCQTYFLLTNDNQVHPKKFIPNKVTGIFFSNKVDYTTWFSPNTECIHGIQMLPLTPILYHLRSPTFILEEYSTILSKLHLTKDEAWQSILLTNQSRINPESSLLALRYNKMDDGLSRSHAIYMALHNLTTKH